MKVSNQRVQYYTEMVLLRIYCYLLLISSFHRKSSHHTWSKLSSTRYQITVLQYPRNNFLFTWSSRVSCWHIDKQNIPYLLDIVLHLYWKDMNLFETTRIIFYENKSTILISSYKLCQDMFAFLVHSHEFKLSVLRIGNIFKHHLSVEMLIMFVLNKNHA